MKRLDIKNKNIVAGYSHRDDGDMREVVNIKNLLDRNKIKYKNIIKPIQTHSENIKIITESMCTPLELIVNVDCCDGLITNIKDIVIIVITADCVPIIFYDEKNEVIGISHQGWKGTLKRLAQKMIKEMLKLKAEEKNIKIFIGPSISQKFYNIDKDRMKFFQKEFKNIDYKFIYNSEGCQSLNLSGLNKIQLIKAGVKIDNIEVSGLCTFEEKDSFFSFRRDGVDKFGEIVSFIVFSSF